MNPIQVIKVAIVAYKCYKVGKKVYDYVKK